MLMRASDSAESSTIILFPLFSLEMRNLFVTRGDKIADLLVLAADFGVDFNLRDWPQLVG